MSVYFFQFGKDKRTVPLSSNAPADVPATPYKPADVPDNAPATTNEPADVPADIADSGSVSDQILLLCKEAKSITELMDVFGYKDKRTIKKYLIPLIQTGQLSRTLPEKPSSPKQKYITVLKI